MKMMQAPIIEGTTPFPHEILTKMYWKLDFSKRAKTLSHFRVSHERELQPPTSFLPRTTFHKF